MYTLHLAKPRFKFSSSHFTVFGADRGEALHGHNYQVQVDMGFADTDPKTGIAVDFGIVKAIIEKLCQSLDEKFLVPEKCSFLKIEKKDSGLFLEFAKKKYQFPLADCEFLPLVNISSEQLCLWFAESLFKELPKGMAQPSKLVVRIDETQGQGASYQLPL